MKERPVAVPLSLSKKSLVGAINDRPYMIPLTGSFSTNWKERPVAVPFLRDAHPAVGYTTSVHFLGKAVGWSRGFSHFWSQMTPSQRPILNPQFSKVEW